MATSFFGMLNPSRTQPNQWPKINIWNQRENTGPSTIIDIRRCLDLQVRVLPLHFYTYMYGLRSCLLPRVANNSRYYILPRSN